MKNFTNLLLIASLAISAFSTVSAQADTTWVQTYTWEEQNNPETAYDSPGRRWFEFPASDNGEEYRKVLMYHKLKCFSDGTAGNLGYACGEWDYLSYNYLFDHTGLMDSTFLTHPQYRINNADFDLDIVIFNPTGGAPKNTYMISYTKHIHSFDGSETVALDSEATEIQGWSVFSGVNQDARVQFLYTADELLAMGVIPNTPIQELRLPSEGFSSQTFTTLRYKFTGDTVVTKPILRGWNNVFEYDTDYSTDLNMGLSSPIVWDGESSILFDMCVENALLIGCNATSAPEKVIIIEPQGRYLDLDGNDIMELLPSALETVSDKVTLEFWLKGDESIPYNTTVFEGVNIDEQRELNTHIPWSNSRVYWDAGNDGGYDRIDELASESALEQEWNHWAFVKNATEGTMEIMLNGSVWYSGTEKDNLIGEITRMFLGGSVGNTNHYTGQIENFRIWNTDLSAETVADWMYYSDISNHPNNVNLVAEYNFDDPSGTFEDEDGGTPYGGFYHGNSARRSHKVADAFLDFEPTNNNARPSFLFVQADLVETSTANIVKNKYEYIAPESVATYVVQGNTVNWSEIEYGWTVGTEYFSIDEFGDTISSSTIEGDHVVYDNSQVLEYYGVPFEVVDRYELGRYITPYGIGLSLGSDGWTWIYDVTDYLPLLRDSIELECGNWQELLDLKFAFIQGTPPRDVMNVDAFWKGMYYLSGWDENVVAHEYIPNEGEEMFKLITRASGHGFGEGNNCAEFCYNTHTASVNGVALGSWEIMQECSDNPLYPQGGTWIYDRAAWCPGDKVAQQEFELTDYVTYGEAFDVEYDINYDPYGNYRMEGQVIAYGAPNMSVDVELMDILAPNNKKVLSRWNPVCENPTVLIRNNGSQLLNSCTFTYGIEGEELQSYVWTADSPLAFLETAEVSLPYDAPAYTIGDEDDLLTFEVNVEVADGFDQEPNNGTGYSQFRRPPTYAYNSLDDNRIIVWTKTNNSPFETSVELLNSNEEVIWSRNYTEAGTTYKDTLALNAGCYRFNVLDNDDDGMDFWANNDGAGYVRLKKVAGSTFVTFEADFGKSISQAFRFETDIVNEVDDLVIREDALVSMNVYPNPVKSNLMVSFQDWDAELKWELRNSMGMLIRQGDFQTVSNRVLNIDVEGIASGIYSLSVVGGGEKAMRWVVKE
jgi:hypothetical protein